MRLRVLCARNIVARASSRPLAASTPVLSHHIPVHRHAPVISRVRYNASLAPSSVSASPSSSSLPKESDSDPPGTDSVDHATIDLGTIGAEDAKVLTIADVLNARERALGTDKTLCDYEEWESVADTDTVHDAVLTMGERNIGSLIVTEIKEGIVGIVTERDILKKVSPREELRREMAVRDVMSSHIMCIHPSTTVIDALATMTKENIRHLAVVKGDISSAVKRGSVLEEDMRCVLSITDIVRAFAEFEASKNSTTRGAANKEADEFRETKPRETVTRTTETTDSETTAVSTDAAAAPSSSPATTTSPVVTAATLLKKKHKQIKLILNTRPDDNVTVAEAVEAMAERNFGAVLVVDKEQRVLGIFTERDYIRKVLFELKDPTKLLVTDVMSSVGPVLQVEDSLEKCWNVAATSNCRHFPVLGVLRHEREKELVGILSIKDIVREISKDHHATPGFRLMEFLKSKMEPKRVDPKPKQPESAAAESEAEDSGTVTGSKEATDDEATTDATKEDPSTAASAESEPHKVAEKSQTTASS
uniref:CBS domain-containing protein n=1 Tax=Peronospora matthiolae TaxID=2874970 RepID=A0AAV1UST5_9STRA